jgi:hypothetical protein
LEQFPEARFLPKEIPGWIGRQKDEADVARFVCSLEPIERRRAVAPACVNERKTPGRFTSRLDDIRLAGQPPKIHQQFPNVRGRAGARGSQAPRS